MPLRSPNNNNTALVVMGVLQQLIPVDPMTLQPNTQIGIAQAALNKSLVYIQSKYQMSLNMTAANPFAVHISAGRQSYRANGARMFLGLQEIIIDYCARWDDQDSTIDDIRASNTADLERIAANIQSNNSLAYGGQDYAISIPEMGFSPYKGEFDTTFPGLTMVVHTLTLNINILPFDT